MIVCKNCGNMVKDGENFCEKCGNAVYGNQIPAPTMNSFAQNVNTTGNPILKLLIATGILQVLMLIFWFMDCMEAGALGYKQGISMHAACKGAEAISVITVIGFIVSLILLVLPIITKNLEKRRRFVFPIIIAAWTLLWFLIQVFGSSAIAEQSGLGLVDVHVAIGGYILAISCIAQIVLCIMMSVKTKQLYGSN